MTRRGGSQLSALTGWRLLAGTCLAALGLGSQATLAQGTAVGPQAPAQSDTTDKTASGDSLEVVEVTARFIKEDIQATPMAITAATASELESAHINSIGNLGAIVPNLLTVPGDSQSAGTPLIRMRGVQQGLSSSLAVPPAVAIYTDDVYHATTAGSELDFNDVDHIEVDRGPQSTLSGNASIGGAIKIYTKDPVGDDSGYLSLGTGSFNRLAASGAFDAAITPTLALRVSGSSERQDGFEQRLDFTCEMNKLGTPQLAGTFPAFQPDSLNHGCQLGTLGGINHTVGGAKLRWRPSDQLDVQFEARKRVEHDDETPEVALSYQPNPNPNTTNSLVQAYNAALQKTWGLQLSNAFVAPPGTNGYATYATDCRPSFSFTVPTGFCYPQAKSAEHDLYSGKVHWDITNDIRMTAIGAYTAYTNSFTQNGDQSPLGYVVSHFNNNDYQGTGEVRFDGGLFDNRLNWVVGTFVLRLSGNQKNSINFLTTSQQSIVHGDNSSEAGFFHLDYNLTSRWRVSGGARYTDETIAITIHNPGVLVINSPVGATEHRGDWLLSTDYKITDDILAYANGGSGSRPPGLTTIVNTPRQFVPTAAESLTSYEAGLKTEFFDHHLRANVAAFYTDYKSLSTSVQGYECTGQVGATAIWYPSPASCQQFAPNTGNVQYFINVGIPARIDGFEWELNALPIAHLHLDWSGGFDHFVSGINTPGQAGYLAPGNHIQPTWNTHADAAYDVNTPYGMFTPKMDVTWQSQQDYDPSAQFRAPLPIYVIKPYAITNAEVNYVTPDGKWSAVAGVTNLSDKFYHYQVLQGTLNAQTRLAPPREWVLNFKRTF
jgi:iron complex outermembrane receptor protein